MTDKEALLLELERAGEKGIPAYELPRIAGLQYNARIKELRDEGWEITCVYEGKNAAGRSMTRQVLEGKRCHCGGLMVGTSVGDEYGLKCQECGNYDMS